MGEDDVERLHESRLQFFIGEMRRFASGSIFILIIAAPDGSSVFVCRVPDLPAEGAATFSTDQSACKQAAIRIPAAQLLSALEFRLDAVKQLRADYGLVAILHIILIHLALIHFHFFANKIDSEFLLKKCVSLVFLVRQDASYGAW